MYFQIEEITGLKYIFLKCPKCKEYNIDSLEKCKCCGEKLTIIFQEA